MSNWSPNSPDQNPTENVWGWMEAKVNALKYTTWSEFNAAVHIICKEVTPTMMENLYSSRTKRMRLVIEMGGGKTDY